MAEIEAGEKMNDEAIKDKTKQFYRQLRLLLFSLFLTIGGFALIAIYGSWLLAAGIFLVLWSENIFNRIKFEAKAK